MQEIGIVIPNPQHPLQKVCPAEIIICAQIALFARNRGACVPRVQHATSLRNTQFICHRSRAYGRSCFKCSQNSFFHFRRSCIS